MNLCIVVRSKENRVWSALPNNDYINLVFLELLKEYSIQGDYLKEELL